MADVGSPLWWLTILELRLRERATQIEKMDGYYTGDHPLPFLTKAHQDKLQDEFARMLKESRSNFMRLVVDAVEERLAIDGFRTDSSEEDKGTWEIWQANHLDSEASTAILESLVKGVAYFSVWEDVDGDGMADIAIEDPLETIVAYTPGSNFRKREAAVKVWTDEWTGTERANVYLPTGIHKFEAARSAEEQFATVTTPENEFGGPTHPVRSSSLQPGRSRWVEREDEFVRNPIGIVPIVPLRNRPRVLCEGESEIADAYLIQNQINGFLFLLALAGYFGAHRQRWVTGIKLQKDSNDKPVEPFDVAIDRLFHSENPDARFGDFEQSDLSGYIKAIEQKILHIAVTTRTPRHYLIEEGQSPSGDAIQSAESGLVKKAERKMRPLGEGIEETMRLARMFAGGDASFSSEVVWADARVQTEAEIVDGVVKKKQAGLIGRRQALEDLGYTPQQISRIMEEDVENPPPAGPTTTADDGGEPGGVNDDEPAE